MKVRHLVQEKLMLVREQTHLYERDLAASPEGRIFLFSYTPPLSIYPINN